MEIAGRTAVVTGAARSIGRAVSRRLALEGARVLLVDVDGDAAGRAAAELGALGLDAVAQEADVTDLADVRRLLDRAERELEGADILVNNAGGYQRPVYPDAPLEHWSHTLDLNLRAVMLAIQACVPAMTSRGRGAVVNVASSAGLGLEPHPSPEYAVAKAGVLRLTACLAPLAERGVRVNCLCPHTVATEAVVETIAEHERRGDPLPPELAGPLIALDELAGAVVSLVRDGALAGRVLVMRGGRPPQLLARDAAG